MTRKDYILITKAITDTQERIRDDFAERLMKEARPQIYAEMQHDRETQLRGVRRTAAHLATALTLDNPNFDPTRFLKACGYGASDLKG